MGANARSIIGRWRGSTIKRLASALHEACHDLAVRVEENAPTRTGELAGAVEVIELEQLSKEIASGVIVDSDHALAVEYGTSEMLAEPYWRPAIATEVPRMIAKIRRVAGL